MLPILVTCRTRLTNVKGKVNLNQSLKFGLIKMGFNGVALTSWRDWNVWNLLGEMQVNGSVEFGTGSRLFIGKNGILRIGNNFLLTAKSDIICCKRVNFGDDCLLSWDVLIMDTDSHPIRNENNEIINYDEPIVIGNNVWIGSRTIILKGARIPDNCLIASGSIVNKEFKINNSIIAGNPSKIVKQKIIWHKESF